MKKLTTIILAGGKSTRMGIDKGLINVQGSPMIQHVINLVNPISNEVIIVANNSAYNQFGCKVIPDEIEDKGPIGGIYTGLKAASHDLCFIISCDTPFVNRSIINSLINQFNDKVLVAQNKDRTHHLIGIYPKESVSKIETCINNDILKMQLVNEALQYETIHFDVNEDLFINLNQKSDLEDLPIIAQVKYFGMVAEEVGSTDEVMTIPSQYKKDLKTFFINQYGFLNKMDFKIAVNQVINNFVQNENEHVEIALLPPFAGG